MTERPPMSHFLYELDIFHTHFEKTVHVLARNFSSIKYSDL